MSRPRIADAPQTLCSLQRCAAALAEPGALGSAAPAYRTLKRWNAAGALDTARVAVPGGGRDLFRLEVLLRIARGRVAVDEPILAGPPDSDGHSTNQQPSPQPLHISSGQPERIGDAQAAADTAKLSAQLAKLDARLEEQARLATRLTSMLEALQHGVANLDATRRSLMAKYDAENQALRAKIADLERENATLRTASNPIDVGKFNILLSRVLDALAARAP